MPSPLNIADRLRKSAQRWPFQRAVVVPGGRDRTGQRQYAHFTFRQLDEEADRLARGLIRMGVRPGMRLVLMVPPSLEFIALTFAVFRAGAVCVLIDPGMGRTNIFRCLADVEPDGFVAIPAVHAIRMANAWRLRSARFNVVVGGGATWGVESYHELRAGLSTVPPLPTTRDVDAAAIIFTSGSTGPPKGVVYEHGMFDAQVNLLQELFRIEPGEIDLPAFPLFALFNSAMGVTTVIPDMNPTRPAQVNPTLILEAVNDHGVTQAFGSPALWNRVGRYCTDNAVTLPSLKRCLSAGAPVPVHVLERMTATLVGPMADIHTPYGATESLPVASISGREVLDRTAIQTRNGAGTCVGRLFPQMEVRIIEITDEPVPSMESVRQLPVGEIGEIAVRGPVVTREYFRKPEATRLAKIPDGDSFWHRMGDVGYFDEDDLLWFCGRKTHIVETEHGRLYSVRCEAIFNNHPRVYRSALVGVGLKPAQRPVIIVEPESDEFPKTRHAVDTLTRELLEIAQTSPLTETIETVLFHRSLPVDIRHNVKIFREKLVPWAERQLRRRRG